jgi:rod shape-determining protein MreD
MTFLIGLPMLIVAAVLQSTALSHLHFFGGTVDLILLMTLSWTLAGDWQGGVMWGFIGGLCLDLLSGGPLGASSLGLTLMAYLASLTEGRFWQSHVLLPLATVMLGTAGFHGAYLIGLFLAGQTVNWNLSLSYVTLPAILLNTLCMLPVYQVLRRLHRVIYPAPVTI